MMPSLLPRLLTRRTMLGFGSLVLKACIFLPLPLLCQNRTVASANIPFSFSAGTHVMPAGNYSLYRISDFVYSLRSTSGSEVQNFTVYRASSTTAIDRSQLTFHRYGNQYFLTSFWFQGASDGFQMRPGKAEKEIVAAARPATTPNVFVAFGTGSSPKP